MVPFRDNGHLTEKEKKYNYVFSANRCVIERAFALLKGKFRRLKYLDVNDLSFVPSVVIACCVLHNFILQSERDTVMLDDIELTDIDTVPCSEMESFADTFAIRKRNNIASKL